MEYSSKLSHLIDWFMHDLCFKHHVLQNIFDSTTVARSSLTLNLTSHARIILSAEARH
jgi:hypothetical protein